MIRGWFATWRSVTAFALLVVAACASPTLPLPPPGLPTQSAAADADYVKLSADCGGAESNATIIIVNQNLSVPNDKAVGGARASACGSWDSTVYAHTGDMLTITQEVGTQESTLRLYTVR